MSGQHNKTVCDYNDFRRPRYFHGMLLEDRDFQAEQGYHAAKRRMLNRTLHGSGIVCGLELSAKPDSKEIEVSQGLALDCRGNEIWLDKDLRLDLGKLLKAEAVREAECPPDETAEEENHRYVVIEYREVGVDPVSVYLPGGGCEQRTCEYSRTREGYCVRLIKTCAQEDPEEDGLLKRFCECLKSKTYESKRESKRESERGCLDCGELTEPHQRCQCDALEQFCESSVPCPDCSRCDESDLVVLGRIDLDEKCERIERVCLNDCRRYVLTGRLLQHAVVSVLAGAGDHFGIKDSDITLPPAVKIAQNPIWALCWFLRYFVIERGELETRDCELAPRGARDVVTNEAFEKKLKEVTVQERGATTERIEKLQKKLEDRLRDVETRIGKK
jgi:hypothetical protein